MESINHKTKKNKILFVVVLFVIVALIVSTIYIRDRRKKNAETRLAEECSQVLNEYSSLSDEAEILMQQGKYVEAIRSYMRGINVLKTNEFTLLWCIDRQSLLPTQLFYGYYNHYQRLSLCHYLLSHAILNAKTNPFYLNHAIREVNNAISDIDTYIRTIEEPFFYEKFEKLNFGEIEKEKRKELYKNLLDSYTYLAEKKKSDLLESKKLLESMGPIQQTLLAEYKLLS